AAGLRGNGVGDARSKSAHDLLAVIRGAPATRWPCPLAAEARRRVMDDAEGIVIDGAAAARSGRRRARDVGATAGYVHQVLVVLFQAAARRFVPNAETAAPQQPAIHVLVPVRPRPAGLRDARHVVVAGLPLGRILAPRVAELRVAAPRLLAVRVVLHQRAGVQDLLALGGLQLHLDPVAVR